MRSSIGFAHCAIQGFELAVLEQKVGQDLQLLLGVAERFGTADFGLRRRIDLSPARAQVGISGPLTVAALQNLLAASTGTCLPDAVYGPAVAAEALSAGVPVLAPRDPALVELLGMGANWIRDPQNPWQFAEDLSSFAEGAWSVSHPAEAQAPALFESEAIIEAIETAERVRDVVVLSPRLSEERPLLTLVVVIASEPDIAALTAFLTSAAPAMVILIFEAELGHQHLARAKKAIEMAGISHHGVASFYGGNAAGKRAALHQALLMASGPAYVHLVDLACGDMPSPQSYEMMSAKFLEHPDVAAVELNAFTEPGYALLCDSVPAELRGSLMAKYEVDPGEFFKNFMVNADLVSDQLEFGLLRTINRTLKSPIMLLDRKGHQQ